MGPSSSEPAMKQIRSRTNEKGGRRTLPFRLMLTVGLASLLATLWLIPARAQSGAAAPETPTAEAAAGEAAGQAGHEGAGHGEEQEGSAKIHLPTWISGALKRVWALGPSTLTAAGAVDESGAPIEAAQLKGKSLDFEYEDHHFHGATKPVYALHPTIGSIGSATAGPGVETTQVTVDGRTVRLIAPEVTFALASMFPEGLVISILTALGIGLLVFAMTRNLTRLPSKGQMLLEILYHAADSFVHGLIGPSYKKYVPLIGTSFIYILLMNLAGLIPGWASPTANINVTAGLALVIVAYVQIEGVRANGLVGYLKHFVGEPVWLGPLNVPIHIIGELAKLLSLTIRLFGNIFGEDVVIVILMMLSALFAGGWVPAQAPMYLLAMFTSLVQAMVFSLLACVYIALMTTHEDTGHGEGGHGHEAHGHAHAHA